MTPDAAAAKGDRPATVTGSFLLFTAVPSWLTSTVLHVIVLLLLALLTMPSLQQPDRENELVLGKPEELLDELQSFQDESLDLVQMESLESAETPVETELEPVETPLVTTDMDLTAAPLKVDLDPLASSSIPASDLGQPLGALGGHALEGRGAAARARLVHEGGGTPGSEAAVAQALDWLKNHQLPDGGWSLDHRLGACQGRCPDPGMRAPARFGATALALLPFLGAGQTHLEGEHKEVIDGGLQFLLRGIRFGNNRGILYDEGNYYSHGLCAIVLCEAYAMTQDKKLLLPAQALINETVFAQDPIGGGWRYKPHQPGDTSAVGWQVMALKSGHMGYLSIPRSTIEGVTRFLDSVQLNEGANYGYLEPGTNRRSGTSAVGLLCRMYLGWNKDHPALQAGVDYLSEHGFDKEDMYYNYYATQVLRHYGGPKWETWNEGLRDYLVNTQEKSAHRAGSWIFHVGHSNEAGGRLYCTSLCTMILEVYYRHMPLYRSEAADDEFPL